MTTLDYIEGKHYAPRDLGRVLVLGMGDSGQAVARYLSPLVGTRVQRLCVADSRSIAFAQECVDACALKPGKTAFFDCESVCEAFDLCIVSPGLAPHTALYQSACKASVEMIGEVEFAWRESSTTRRWVAVTGTNGKTTTTALIAHLLQSGGISAVAVGNIGRTCIDEISCGDSDVCVAEVSSFQLASTISFAPNVAVVLNITPDHISWHGSFEEYEQAKLKVLSNLKNVSDAWAVLNATDAHVRAIVRKLRKQDAGQRGFSYVPIGTAEGIASDMRDVCGAENAAFAAGDGKLHIALSGKEAALCSVEELSLCGDHNVANALSAACAASVFGIDVSTIAAALKTFQPLSHRIEPCGYINGVACFNDSKATNVDATRKALTAFAPRKAVFLLGGDDKGTDLSDLVAAMDAHAKAVVCFGAARDRFLHAFDAALVAIPVLSAQGMEGALQAALGIAKQGDSIVLSPACASFDEFTSFEHRGDVFKACVKAYPGFSEEVS